MSESKKKPEIIWHNVAFLTLTPLAALVVTPLYIANHGIVAAEVWALIALWFLTGQGITAGYHRLFSHRGYTAAWPVRLYFAIVGAAACQNSIIAWSSDHRIHHKVVDTDQDPYNAKRGFWFSHIGWIFLGGRRDTTYPNVPDLWADPICRWQHKYYWPITIAFNVAIPLALGLWTGRLGGMLLFACLVRIVLVHHFTFTINSLAHMWGNRPWSTENTARDSWLLSLLSFGEGYHNYHHAYQYDYRNGPFWYNYDPSKWLIWSLSHTPLVSELKRVPDELLIRKRSEYARQRFMQKLAGRGEFSHDEWATFFREGREAMSNRARAVQEALASGSASLTERTELLRLRFRERLAQAEAHLDAALEELRSRRTAWTLNRRRTKQLPKAQRTVAAERDLQEMRQAFRDARRRAMQAFRELVRVYDTGFRAL